jgi:hypothetical protein
MTMTLPPAAYTHLQRAHIRAQYVPMGRISSPREVGGKVLYVLLCMSVIRSAKASLLSGCPSLVSRLRENMNLVEAPSPMISAQT